MNILVVDDEFVSRTKLQTLLSKRGHCDVAENGSEAIQAVTGAYRDGEPYDLVTMDIDMPDMTGQDVLQHIRQWERNHSDAIGDHEVKFLMITAMRNPRDVMSSFSSGAEWYLNKPVTPQSLDEAIGKVDFLGVSHRPEPQEAPPDKPAPARGDRAPGACSALPLPEPTSINIETVDHEFLADYLDSTRSKLIALEADALSLDESAEHEELENALMRNLHSLKGEAGMIGLNEVQALCHHAESLIKDSPGSEETPDMVLALKDWLEAVVAYVADPTRLPSATPRGKEAASEPVEPVEPAEPSPPSPLPDVRDISLENLKADFLGEYVQTSREKLQQLRTCAEGLQQGADTQTHSTAIIDLLNALKGEGAMIGLPDVLQTLQDIETRFQNCSHKPACADLILHTADWLEALLGRLEPHLQQA